MSQRVIELAVDRCTGCAACELVCSFAKEGRFSPKLSRIRVHLDEALCLAIPNLCLQCSNAPCVAVCPTGALTRDPVTGVVVLEQLQCIGCRVCGSSCPFGAIYFHSGVDHPLKCDLCGGAPQCVRICQAGALLLVSREEIGSTRRSLHINLVQQELEQRTGEDSLSA